VLGLVAVAVLVLATSFFVAAEFSLVAVDRDRIETLAERGDRRARVTRSLLHRLSFFLSGAQLGVTVMSLVLGFIAKPTVARAIEPLLGFLPNSLETPVAITLAFVIVTVVAMVVGELIPKGIAVADAQAVALVVSPPMRVYGVVFGPVIKVLNLTASRAMRALGIEPREELRSVRTIDELELLIESSGEEGTLEPEAFNLLARTIRFGNKTVGDILVPRVDMVSIDEAATVADLVTVAVGSGHSRFPVVRNDSDDVIGIVHANEVLAVPVDERASAPIAAIMRTPLFVPEGRDLESLLTEMRHGAERLAVVIDEYGGVSGVVSLEDLLEEIVGDIEDEHDQPPALTRALAEGTSVVEGSLHLDEVDEVTGFEVPEGPYETLAGFLLARLGHIPVPGERVVVDGWRFEVLSMDRRRIATIKVDAPRGEGARP
jgi:CBS domain containing-hemolysin-like protein